MKARKVSKDRRLRDEVFPNSEGLVFDTNTKGFVPLPIVFRKLLRYLSATQLRVLIYLHLRAGKEGVCYPTTEEIAHDVGLKTPKHVKPQLRELGRMAFIQSRMKRGRVFYLVHDPAVAIRQLHKLGVITEDEVRDINGLREDLGQEPVLIEETETR